MADLVSIPSPGEALYFGEEGDPLVIVIHDWYGRLPWLEFYARAVASHGYRVAVPDLYKGWATTNSTDAAELMRASDIGETLAIITRLIDEARAQGSAKVATVGFSMGGWVALVHAENGAVDAVVSYYASLSAADHGIIPAPVLLHFAETDDWDEGEEPEDFIARLADHGTPVASHTYLGTRHSFANATLPERLDKNAAALAFARTVTFLDVQLS
jgi:carboxymethylenebutenolidase